MWHTGCTGQQPLAMGRIQDGPILRNTVLIDIFSIGKVFYMWIYMQLFFFKLSDFDICYKKLTASQAQYPHNLVIFIYYVSH